MQEVQKDARNNFIGTSRPTILMEPALSERETVRFHTPLVSPQLPTQKSFRFGPAILLGGLVLLAAFAFGLRYLLRESQSAYIDEAGQILAGRYLLEKHAAYAYILEWSYGSYLWPLSAGLADILGGLNGVRMLTALLGVIMVGATAISTARLLPATLAPRQRFLAAGLAGLIMAIMPTAIGIGRFGTYDSLAGAAFMSGVAMLLPLRRPGAGQSFQLLAAAGLFFVAFLAKYIIALYFPFICLYLLLSPLLAKPRNWRQSVVNFIGFVLPLALSCAAYFVLTRNELLKLLSFSTGYTDLKSNDPFLQYVWERPEIWLLVGLASFGWGHTTRLGRLVAVTGVAIIAVFQTFGRADYDFWKHSIYIIFFLAPLAGLALTNLTVRVLGNHQPRRPHRPGLKKVRVVVLSLLAVAILAAALPLSLAQANLLVTFYPDLTPALPTLQAQTAQARTVLTDDTAVRYYLYPRIPTEQIIDPFYFEYHGLENKAAYRQALTERFFDVVVLDGSIGPIGKALRQNIDDVLRQNYEPVYSQPNRHGTQVEIFRPRQCQVTPAQNGSKVYSFGTSQQNWGGRLETGNLQPGLQVALSSARACGNQTSLQFNLTPTAQTVGVGHEGPVSQVKAQIYLETPAGADPTAQVPVGMIGFDQNWQYHDDGYKQNVLPGRWIEVRWQLTQPGYYHELGLRFPTGVKTAYIGQVEILP